MADCLNLAQFLPTFTNHHKLLVNETKDLGPIEGPSGAGMHQTWFNFVA
jgi:hypothetical protein